MIVRRVYFDSFDKAMEWYNKQISTDYNHNYSEPVFNKKKGYVIIVETILKARTDQLIGGKTKHTNDSITDFKRNENIYIGTQIHKFHEHKDMNIDSTLYCDICGDYQKKKHYECYKMCKNCYKQSKQTGEIK